MQTPRRFKTGEFILVGEDIVNSKGEVVVPAGGSARIMVFDPSKGDTPYGLRGNEGVMTQAYVGEAMLHKDPSMAHHTPKGF